MFEMMNQNQISMRELFSDEFISSHSKFESLAQFMQATGFELQTQKDLVKISPKQWNDFTKNHTQFNSFEEMKTAAIEQLVIKRLGE